MNNRRLLTRAIQGDTMTIRVFDVGELTIEYNASAVYDSWEESIRDILDEDEEFIDLDSVGGNRQFAPLSTMGMEDLRVLSIKESQHLHDIQEGHRTINDILEAEEELWEDDEVDPYMILDVGVRTVVMALLELGAEPFSSCNGGSFPDDERHAESHPLVAMYGSDDVLAIIEDAARKHQCGLYGTDGFGGKGALVLYTDDIRKFISVAHEFFRLGFD
jgi:hypothetical protein